MTWEGHADKVKVPYLCVAGEFDELSPVEHSFRLVEAVKGPKRIVVYQESRHSVGNVPPPTSGRSRRSWWRTGSPIASPASRSRTSTGTCAATGQIDKKPL